MNYVIIAGSRSLEEVIQTHPSVKYDLFNRIHKILEPLQDITILSGNARGADTLGEEYASLRNIPTLLYPAEWDTYSKRAGFVRNRAMAALATHLIAIHDGQSKGTADMIPLANIKGIPVRIISF